MENYYGVVSVSLIETIDTRQLLTYALPSTLLHPCSREIASLIEQPKPHSKRCVRDFGKTHVIFPSNLHSLNSFRELSDNTEQSADDVINELSHDLSSNLSLHNESVRVEQQELASYGLENPWNSKVLEDAWFKLRSHSNGDQPKIEPREVKPKIKRFLLLENVTSPYHHPSVLDLKMGTRIRENPSSAKLARHVTTIELGARLSGMQIYHPSKKAFSYVNKYCGHELNVRGFEAKLVEFFSRGKTQTSKDQKPATAEDDDVTVCISKCHVDRGLVESAVTKLLALRQTILSLDAFRFYSCSLLLIYDGDDAPTVPDEKVSAPPLCKTGSSDVDPLHDDVINPSKSTPPHESVNATSKHPILQSPPVSDLQSPLQSGPPHSLEFSQPASTTVSETKRNSSKKKREKAGLLSVGAGGDTKKLKDLIEPSDNSSLEDTAKDQLLPRDTSPVQQTSSKQETSSKSEIEIRLIDFAHFCSQDPVVHPGPDGGFLYGIDKLVQLLKSML